MVPFTFSHESSVQGLLPSKCILNIRQKDKAIIPIILQKEHLNSHKNAFSLKKFIHFEVSFDGETYETKKILGLFVVQKNFKSTAVFFGDSLFYYSEHTTPTHEIKLNIPELKGIRRSCQYLKAEELGRTGEKRGLKPGR